MTVLRDREIIDLIRGEPALASNVVLPGVRSDAIGQVVDELWFTKDSPVQPSSLDLHIGEIFIPNQDRGTPGAVDHPIESHTLRFGHTAVVRTREELNLPNDIAGFGFPPATVAFGGLLMINPGHIDPGFAGPLSCTVINVGKAPISLEKGHSIFTLLLVRLNTEAEKGYRDRRTATTSDEERLNRFEKQIDRLSVDFLDVQKRTEDAATDAVKRAAFMGPIWAAALGIIGAGLIAAAKPYVDDYLTSSDDLLMHRVEVLEKTLAVGDPKTRIDDIEKKITELSEPEDVQEGVSENGK